jgi:hypothetical protein
MNLTSDPTFSERPVRPKDKASLECGQPVRPPSNATLYKLFISSDVVDE